METNTAPTLHMKKFIFMSHKYPTRYSRNSFKSHDGKLKITDYDILSRGSHLWNELTNSFKSHERKLKITDYDVLSRGSHLWNELTNTQLKKISALLFSLKKNF